MSVIEKVTLESLLNPYADYNLNMNRNVEPEIVMMECIDILQDISILEQNITAYEAAKSVKKAKSCPKKKKICTSKKKAFDVKNLKKKGAKVLKIIKEGDAYIDGGSGPLATTSATNGLTDTDLDADPNATVQVTEIVDDGTPEEKIVGTEGVDFVYIYDDPDIVAYEGSIKDSFTAIGKKLKELWGRVVEFVKNVFDKVLAFLGDDGKFLAQNKEKIEKGLQKADAKVSVSAYVNPAKLAELFKATQATVTTMCTKAIEINVSGKSMKEGVDESLLDIKIMDVPLSGGNDTPFYKNLAAKVFEADSPVLKEDSSATEVPFNKTGVGTIQALEQVAGSTAIAQWKGLKSSFDGNAKKLISVIDRKLQETAKEAREKNNEATEQLEGEVRSKKRDEFNKIQKAAVSCQKAISTVFTIYNQSRNTASKVMRKAASVG